MSLLLFVYKKLELENRISTKINITKMKWLLKKSQETELDIQNKAGLSVQKSTFTQSERMK